MKRSYAVFAIFAAFHVHADPLQAFEQIVTSCQTVLDKRPLTEVVFLEKQNLWAKRISRPVQISYDVKKTDSLVTPLSAYLEFTEVTAVKTASDEAGAIAAEVSFEERVIRKTNRWNFAFRSSSSSWEFANGKLTAQGKLTAKDQFDKGMEMPVTKEDILAYKSEMKNCISSR